MLRFIVYFMPQFDCIIIEPLLISMLIIMTYCYYVSMQLLIKEIKLLKFRKKILNLLNNHPLDNILKLKDIVYFEKK